MKEGKGKKKKKGRPHKSGKPRGRRGTTSRDKHNKNRPKDRTDVYGPPSTQI